MNGACVLVREPQAALAGGLKAAFDHIETIGRDDHWWRYVLECRCCGQLYLFDFSETVIWSSGNDPQKSIWVPLESAEALARLRSISSAALEGHTPRLVKDWPADAEAPQLSWVR